MKEIIPTNWEENHSIIKVIGVGGGGGNAVNHMYYIGIKDVDFVICNTDEQALTHSPIPEKLQLGELLTKGRGTGCDPELARKAALESKDKIVHLLGGTTEMVFITAGMGGGTGTGAAPVIAQLAKEMGLLTVGVVTLPFHDEGPDFLKRALEGIHEMQKHADSLLVIDNEKLYKVFGDLPIYKAFPKADDVLAIAVKGIAEIITRHGFINVDFADVKMVMKNSGMALMGSGSASGEKRALKAVEEAFSSPLLNDVDLKSARNVLVNITSGMDGGLSMIELAQVMDYIKESTCGVQNFKRGVVYDPAIGDAIHVTIVATGLDMSGLPRLTPKKGEQAEPSVFLGEPEPHIPAPSRPFQVGNNPHAPIRMPVPAAPAKPVAGKREKPVLILEPGDEITKLETIPAYIRQQKKIDRGSAHEVEIGSVMIEDRNGKQLLHSDNSYIHQTQD